MANAIFENLSVTIFELMSGLARQGDVINLGQGFPEHPGPLTLRQKAAEFAIEGPHQYPPIPGMPDLRIAVGEFYRTRQRIELAWQDEITITTGASEALAASLFALLSPGDEVVLFEPAYDAYLPLVQRAGGTPRYVQLRPPDWTFTRSDLEKVFSAKTKVVLFNNPMNPTGKVFSNESLALLAEFCVRYDAVAICDEVWEEIIFDGHVHEPLMCFPGMRSRTVKIGSAGKLFSLTGWKVGFVLADAGLTSSIRKAHQLFSFTVPPNLQLAVAWGLGNCDEFLSTLSGTFQSSRDYLVQELHREGFSALESRATYFVNVDLTASGIGEDDLSFCLQTVKQHGLAMIPISSFCRERYLNTLVRVCFAKEESVLQKAVQRLASARDASLHKT